MLVTATCVGFTPYLMNPATPALLERLRKGSSSGPPQARDEKTLEEEAAEKLFVVGGRVGFLGDNLLSCLVEAGRHVQHAGKTKLSTTGSSLVPAFLTIEQEFVPFTGNPGWVADVRMGRNPRGSEAVAIVRPRFDAWGFEVTLRLARELEASKARELLEKAGSYIGLGDWRPQRRGKFGKFEVEAWSVLKQPAKKAAVKVVQPTSP